MNNEAINLIDKGCRYGKHPTWKDIPDINCVGLDLDSEIIVHEITRNFISLSCSDNSTKNPC